MGFATWWKCKNCETTGPDLNKRKCPRYIEAEGQEQGPKPSKRRKMTEGKDLSKVNISSKDKKSARERQDIQNQQEINIAAHKEVGKFEIPTNSPTNVAEESDIQTNHRFFHGPEIRRQAYNKAEQKCTEDKGNKVSKRQKQKGDNVIDKTSTRDKITIKMDKDIGADTNQRQEHQKDSTISFKRRKTDEEQETEDHKTSGSSKDYDGRQQKQNDSGGKS